MDGPQDGSRCGKCGAACTADTGCVECGQAARPSLTVVRGGADGMAAAAAVPMIRELKLKTLDHLDLDAVLDDAELPATARAVEGALADGDLAAADALLDRALGCVLAGPGHQRRATRSRWLPLVLWAWCGVLLVVFCAARLGVRV